MMDSTPDPDSAPQKWSEERVEKLLSWFFAEELPPALRDAQPAPPSQPVQASTAGLPARTARQSPWWLVPICVSALVGSVWMLGQTPRQHSPLNAAFPSITSIELELTGLPLVVEQVSFAGSNGIFQQRSELRWISHSDYDPEAGVWVEWSAPELAIDIELASEPRL